MKRFARSIVLWAVFALFPVSVSAQITDFTGTLGSEEYMNFVSGSDVVSDRYLDGNRVYVGPYVGNFDRGDGLTTPNFSLLCVDFDNYAGSQRVNVTGLGSASDDSDLGATRLGGSAGSLTRYRQAAYLGSLFDSWEGLEYDAGQGQLWTAIHSAVWTVMTGREIGGSEYDLRDRILADHSEASGDFTADGWYVLSGEGDETAQEMLIRTPASTVPEPSTYLLMATGLLFLVAFGRKRMSGLSEG
ncbi:MAG: PEP-CTERM sorting domain-containing protein [Gemmatimonadota bacterium]|nr:PEP-CTERM sorting domain-containing protein [Gemmatimonadota bacterium]